MSDEWIRISAPATTSNIGAGFDIFGLAIHEPADIIEGRKIPSGMVISEITGPGAEGIPTDPKENSVTIAAQAVLDEMGADFGIEVKIHKGIRPCSGIGSSGASAAGGAYLAYVMTGEKMPMDRLIMCAAQSEKHTSGAVHCDNVAPCILGGFTIIPSYDPFEVLRIEPPEDLGLVVTLPDVMVATADARKVLPKEVPVKDLVFHTGHASAMVYGMMKGDLELIGRSVRDAVFEPARKHLVPHLAEAEKAAVDAGALTSFLGGSGPAIMAFYDRKKGEEQGRRIADAVKRVFDDAGMEADVWVTVCGTGCRRI